MPVTLGAGVDPIDARDIRGGVDPIDARDIRGWGQTY